MSFCPKESLGYGKGTPTSPSHCWYPSTSALGWKKAPLVFLLKQIWATRAPNRGGRSRRGEKKGKMRQNHHEVSWWGFRPSFLQSYQKGMDQKSLHMQITFLQLFAAVLLLQWHQILIAMQKRSGGAAPRKSWRNIFGSCQKRIELLYSAALTASSVGIWAKLSVCQRSTPSPPQTSTKLSIRIS